MCFICDQRGARIAAVNGLHGRIRGRWTAALLFVGACGSRPPVVAPDAESAALVLPRSSEVERRETAAAAAPVVLAERGDVTPARGCERRDVSSLERSTCLCEEQCARRVDRAALTARWERAGGEAPSWLTAGQPGTLHYPYREVDGLVLEIDGDGRVTRCSHSVLSDPSATVAIDCAASQRR